MLWLVERRVHLVLSEFMELRRVFIAFWLGIMLVERRLLWHEDLTALKISLGFGRGMDLFESGISRCLLV